MDRDGVAALLVAFVVVLVGILYALDRGAFREPWGSAKTLGAIAIVLVLVAVPFAVLDGRARSRFRAAERRLRAERPGDAVTEHDGAEGRGLLFEGAQDRVLLLHAPGGLGAPRIVALPSAPPAEPDVAEPSV